MTHPSGYLLAAVSHVKKERFLNGLWDGAKALLLTVYHAFTRHNPNPAYHIGYILGVLLILALFLFIVSFAVRR
jgi:hypothetical protein